MGLTTHPIVNVSQRAKQLGYATAVRKGRLQFQVITPKAGGDCDIQRITGWLTANEATKLLNESGA